MKKLLLSSFYMDSLEKKNQLVWMKYSKVAS